MARVAVIGIGNVLMGDDAAGPTAVKLLEAGWEFSPEVEVIEGGTPGLDIASLVGNPVAVPERPLEALRTIHSFDPCLACAIHTVDGEGREIAQVKVL